jgi:hypothetical protein
LFVVFARQFHETNCVHRHAMCEKSMKPEVSQKHQTVPQKCVEHTGFTVDTTTIVLPG